MQYLFLMVFFLVAIQSVDAQVYQWVDDSGRTHYSDKPQAPKVDSSPQNTQLKKVRRKTNITPVHYNESITLKTRALLKNKAFKKLNSYLAVLQKRLDENIANELDLYAAIYAFKIKDKSYEVLFNKWVESTPDNHFPYLARARFYYGLGWVSRGYTWASETKAEQMKEMTDYFNKAMVDINTVLKINDQSLPAYTTVMNIANVFGKGAEAAAVTKKALEIQPASYVVRNTYLNSIKPRWGGSYKKMAVFIEYSLRYAEDNPELNCLAGEIDADRASMSSIREAPQASEKQYNLALRFGDCHATLKKRGVIRYKLGKYHEALDDLDRAIEIYSEDADYYYWRAKIYMKLKDKTKAMSDIQYATKLDPYKKKILNLHEWLLVNEGYNLRNSNKKRSEIDKYNAALRINPKNADTYARRARAYVAQGKNKLAINDLDKAIKLEPNNIEHYVLIDFILAKSSSWKKIIPYWDKYIALNPNSGRAYRDRGGAYYRMGDMQSAKRDAKRSAGLGDLGGKDIYKRFFNGR